MAHLNCFPVLFMQIECLKRIKVESNSTEFEKQLMDIPFMNIKKN